MSSNHGHMPGPDILPDTLAQAAACDYEEAQAETAMDLSAKEAAAKDAAEKASEAVGSMRSTGIVLGETAAAAAHRVAEAKDAIAHTATDLEASTTGAVRDAGQRLSSAAEEAAARASAAAEAAQTKARDTQADAGGWSWEGAKGWALDAWQDWQHLPRQWLEVAQEKAQDWQPALNWQGFDEGQERHWWVFEERQLRHLAAMTEEQRERWQSWEERQRRRLGELTIEGEQLVRREIGAFEEWQQRYWRQHHPNVAAGAPRPGEKNNYPNCRLSYLMLPLLPNVRASIDLFGCKTKMGIVGEMRDTGSKLAESLQAAGEVLGLAGKKGE